MKMLIPAALAATLALGACGNSGQDASAGSDTAQTAAAGAQATATGANVPDAAPESAGDTFSAPAATYSNTDNPPGSGPQGVTPRYGEPGGAPSAVTSQSKGSSPSVGNDAPPNIN